MKHIKDIKKGTYARALVRVDYNVPIVGNKIKDTRRITASFATIDLLRKKGIQVLLVAHRGQSSETLRPVATYLSRHYPVVFISEPLSHTKKIQELLACIDKHTVVLFENIRRYPEEETNNKAFAATLARLGDSYVNDAFSVSHRAHASVVGLSRLLPSYAGIQLEKEVSLLSSVRDVPRHPYVLILGGAKFSTKIPLLKQSLKTADHIIIAGAIANSFLKVAGYEIGASVVESAYDTEIRTLLKNEKILIPVDVCVLRGTKRVVVSIDAVEEKDIIVDIGPQTTDLIRLKVQKAKTVVWNGPTGWYEKGFTKATIAIAKTLGQIKARTLIGGGDTGAVIEKVIGDSKYVSISTGGGATLEYLAKGTLVGVQSLQKK